MSSNQLFGKAVIPSHHIFLARKNVFAFPSWRPVTEGHVLVATKRVVGKLSDLTEIETIDIWVTAMQIAKAFK